MKKLLFFLLNYCCITQINAQYPNPENVPYSFGFETTPESVGWLTTGTHWIRSYDSGNQHSANDGIYYMFIQSVVNHPRNDYVFTPKINLLANKTYRVTFYARLHNLSSSSQKYKLTYGAGQTIAQQTNVIANSITISNMNAYQKYMVDFTPTMSGNYNIGIGCVVPAGTVALTYLDSVSIVDLSSLSVDDINNPNKNSTVIYPNPIRNQFQINLNSNFNISKTKITISDLNGKLIRESEYAKNYETSYLPKGTYLITISDGNKTETKKIIKE